MALQDVLAELRGDPQFMANVTAWRTLNAQPPRLAPIPPRLHPRLQAALHARGLSQLYTHQAQAVQLALDGRNVVVVTPTASGKTLCYNLPVLHSLLEQPAPAEPLARALYLFPTKALAHDQLAELHAWEHALFPELQSRNARQAGGALGIAAYDGDTPSAERTRLRKHARLLLTNPDMLHSGILPYHGNWGEFFAGLRYVLIDELHIYRGVFGSHVANVLRRLQRICAFHGAYPQFICASATIANPRQLAEKLIEKPVEVVDENGAPRGEKHIILYNPPIYDAERGLRRSSVLETQELAARCVLGGVQTILFGRSRLTTEVLLSYLRERLDTQPGRRPVTRQLNSDTARQIRGYRGGYLPTERRAIEAGLRNGDVRAVVATNALELGIDIGRLQAALLCGYPGSIAAAWQQMGRAGRTSEASLAILVATGGALDQYIIRHPEFLFERTPEHALINPDNLMLLVDQMRCAAFELPFEAGETLGKSPFGEDVLQLLVEQGELQQHGPRYFWASAAYPARMVSLRSSSNERVTIQVEGAYNSWSEEPNQNGSPRVIGEIEVGAAPMLLHEGAIYLHEGQSYLVTALDLPNYLAQVRPLEVDYYTEVVGDANIEVLAEHERKEQHGSIAGYGDLRVSSQVVGYRRIKRFTHETLGVFPLDYPPHELETSGYWLMISAETQAALERAGEWMDSINDYGPNWEEQRQRVRARDGYRCKQCGAPEVPGRQHDVHHLVPFRTFGYVRGVNEHYLEANRLGNLILVCRACHQRLESAVRTRTGLDGVAYALTNLAPLHLMCDPQDIGVHVERSKPLQGDATRAGETLPTIYIYERIAAGLGFSSRLFELHNSLLSAAHDLIARCPCPHGCPACVGPVLDTMVDVMDTKRLALALLAQITGEETVTPLPVVGDVEF